MRREQSVARRATDPSSCTAESPDSEQHFLFERDKNRYVSRIVSLMQRLLVQRTHCCRLLLTEIPKRALLLSLPLYLILCRLARCVSLLVRVPT